jgi:hypothetical protein
MLVTAALAAPGKDFPLEFKTLKPEEIKTFPGVFFTYGRLQTAKPEALKKEPKAMCRQPFYGQLNGKQNAFVFRIEESKEGKGYDRLLIDLNQNGDLTDDPVIEGQIQAEPDKSLPKSQFTTFWPIPVSADRMIGSWRPVYLGELRVDTRGGGKGEDVYIGLLRVYAGWYLETTVEVDGFKQKAGVIDTAAQMRLGNEWKPHIPSGSGNWYFNAGDSLLLDKDGSGSFERALFGSEAEALSEFHYIGPHPCKVSLSRDCKCLQVEKWAEPLAEVTVRPHGEQVQSVSLAWERPKGQWQLLSLKLADGKTRVPPGNYRFESCSVKAKSDRGEPVVAGGMLIRMETPMKFAVGKANILRCGAPLRVEASAEKRKPQDWVLQRQGTTAVDPKVDSEFVLAISAQIQGVRNETYALFRTRQDFKQTASKPAFTVADAQGKVVGSGNLEFG